MALRGRRPPRLAYVTGTYPVLSETFVTGEIRELARSGEEPLVFAVLRGHAEVEGIPPAQYVVELPKRRQLAALARLLARRPRRTVRALLDPARRFGGSPRDVAALAPLALAAEGVRHIHAHWATQPAAVAGRLAALTGSPFSFAAHAHDIFVDPELLAEKVRAAKFVVTDCEYNRRHFARHAPGPVHVLVLGVDLDAFRRERPYVPDGPLVAVGRLVEKKGFEYLVRAAAAARGRIPEVVIAGEGPERAPLERLIAELEAPVRLAGAPSHLEVRDLYEQASAGVLPCVVASDGDRDSMPVAIKEAMAMELPVVATDEVGIPEMVAPDRGILVPPRDHDALAAALVELYARRPEERVRMGRAGRAFVAERCNLRTETERLRALFALDRAEGL